MSRMFVISFFVLFLVFNFFVLCCKRYWYLNSVSFIHFFIMVLGQVFTCSSVRESHYRFKRYHSAKTLCYCGARSINKVFL